MMEAFLKSLLTRLRSRRNSLQATLALKCWWWAFQKMVFGAVEGTLLNLVQEALHHEFDLTAPPIQRCMPEGSEE